MPATIFREILAKGKGEVLRNTKKRLLEITWSYEEGRDHDELQVMTQGSPQLMMDHLEPQVLREGSCLPAEARDTHPHYGRVDLDLRSAGRCEAEGEEEERGGGKRREKEEGRKGRGEKLERGGGEERRGEGQ